ncbi:MAG TPA: FAD-dependent oxidoreductase [Amycolatopsis sp.]|nr:FAD-dependent oxidoreductase [Amycolatopsis sp.]
MRPIVIVGAGIAGLALAAALQRRGAPVLVLEAHDRLSTAGAGISLWPNALAALDEIGLGAPVREAGGAAISGGIRRADGRWLRHVDPARAQAALGEPVVAIHRADLLAILASVVDAGAIRFATKVEQIAPSTSEVTVGMADGSSLAARAVVGADGVGSVAARHLNPRVARRYAGYTAWRGIAEHNLRGIEPSQTWGPGGEFGFLPMGPHRTYWFATQHAPEGQRREPERELAHLSRIYANWHPPIGELIEATEPGNLLRHDVHDRPAARTWSAGPVTLIGDAAHPMRPHLGQGGCQALIDAVVLARLIAQADTLPAAFAQFAARRRGDTGRAIRTSAILGSVIHSRGPLRPLLHALAGVTPQVVAVRAMATIAGRHAFPAP